ncbi:2-oxo acid dehydrogenase subunit E2 [Flavihumibacter rivuli]|uniref:dihydrolipoamide acetyltransferase family protein n=1 Tax=Flavihumibacter rivuli TaxID=2838156 RepID=UPI001BDEF9C0|nr:dihydrolipoamide acetyltransferase family protein [Flavihumibacter rivuli]ULQ57609.1 2-oxo acid dehydrogenase subunit E2 [Flavihumibacter rivuli]
MVEFKMPSLGADMEAGSLREWLVKPGDHVKRGDIIAIVETQKGLIDIEVFQEGTINSLLTKVDEKVPVGTVMALIDSGEPEKKTTPTAIPQVKKEEVRIKASPLARKLAADHSINLESITGTGEGGVITKEDVEKLIATQVPSTAPVAGEKDYNESIRMAIAAAMSKSNREIPHYYLEKKMDMTRALAWLGNYNKEHPIKERLLPVALLVKALAKALADVPQLNGYWDKSFQPKTAINIGFTISLRPGGIIVPAILQADKRSVPEIMQVLNDLIPRARSLKLRSSELSDATITLTSLGEGQADTVFGMVYPPQVAIIGLGSIREEPWAENGMLDVRSVINVTLAADHRASDGLVGSKLLTAFEHYLQEPEKL